MNHILLALADFRPVFTRSVPQTEKDTEDTHDGGYTIHQIKDSCYLGAKFEEGQGSTYKCS